MLARRCRAGVLAAGGMATFGVVGLLTWNGSLVTTTMPIYVVLFVIVGAPGVVATTGLFTALQGAGGDRVGRVFGVLTTVAAAGQALGMIVGGLLGDRVHLVALLNVQAGLYLLAALVAAVGLTGRAAGRAAAGDTGRTATGLVTGDKEKKGRPPSGETGVANESGSGGFEPNPLGDSGGMQPPSVNPGATVKT